MELTVKSVQDLTDSMVDLEVWTASLGLLRAEST